MPDGAARPRRARPSRSSRSLVLGLVARAAAVLRLHGAAPGDYADTAPAFDLRQTLNGPLVASGVIYGPTGRVATRFVADMQGTWDAAGGTLAEDFRYATGRTQQRAWRIVSGPDGRFTATADDVVGAGERRRSPARPRCCATACACRRRPAAGRST